MSEDCYLHAGKHARYLREFNFARCHDEVVSEMLHGRAVANTSRIGRSISPAAGSCSRISALGSKGKQNC